ncbi:MAG: hypothetical protein IK052_01015 [Bacteroidales bacterium]|nr:hypothetical protein [Bacteroidales bacterium]
MKAAFSHFTSSAMVILGALLCALPLSAQSLWEEGRNIAGEAAGADIGHNADAHIGGKFTSGDFRSPSMGKTLWTGEVKTEAVSSYQDLYLKGDFGFELVHGTEMMGSMFTEPGLYPVDVLEFTPGTKVKQTYSIGGGFAWKNGSRWTPGVSARFCGINYAKRKDLRHTTYRQEFEIVPSVHYKGEGFQIGLSAILDRNSEFITAEQVGQAKAESYMAFLDKGMRYGTLQAWDGSGIHLKEAGVDRFPVKQLSFGAALQGSIGDLLYADIEYLRSNGEVGEKGYTWFRFPSSEISAKVILTLRSKEATHLIRADYDWFYLDNYETVLEKQTSEGGVTTPREFGSNRIFRNRYFSVSPSYRIIHSRGWAAGTAVRLENDRKLGTFMYPFYDDDRSLHMSWMLNGMVPVWRFILSGNFMLKCKIGEHTHVVDTADPSLGTTSTPTRLQDWWNREQEADDATQFMLGGSVRYNIGLGMYVEAGCTWRHAFNITLLPGCDRQTTYLKFGYNF